jgi:hypothetical protein
MENSFGFWVGFVVATAAHNGEIWQMFLVGPGGHISTQPQSP